MMEPYDIARRLGMDASRGVHRSNDGLRNARRAHPTSHPRGFANGSTSTRDVQEVSRYFQMQGLGVERPGPGLRSRRRGVDSEATVGDTETQNMTGLRHVAGAHREASIFVYQQHGRLHPKLWIESDDKIILIEPSRWEDCDITDWQRAQMLSASMRVIDASLIGRCDEVYIRDLHVPGVPLKGENLADLVDFDPSIRSALMVHALDLRTTETYLTMATFDLDNQGSPFWERHESMSYYASFAVPLWAAAKLMRRKDPRWSLPIDEAESIIEDNGWIMTRLDK